MPQIKNPNTNSKWDRINTIYEILKQSHGGISIQELSSKMGVSSKTIQRDLYDVLTEFGAIKSGRMWKLDTRQASDALSSNERIILGILDEMAKNAGSSFYGKAHSLLKQISQQLEHPIFAHIESEVLEEAHIDLFSRLEHSIKHKQTITFEYKKYTFTLKPLKLAFFDGFWYLLGLDCKDGDKFKKFHLKSISHLSANLERFQISTQFETALKNANSIWFDLDNEPFDVHLLISKEVMPYFERKPLKAQSIVGKDFDGSTEIVISITHEMEIMPLILWYIPHIKVLEPAWLAEAIKEKVSEYLKSIA